MKHTLATLALLGLCSASFAQNIERVKMTDNDLSCQQIYGEIGQMDGMISLSAQAPTAVADSGASGQVASAVAQSAIANIAARSGGFGGFGGFGGGAGGLGGMFGGIAQQLAQGATAQQAASSGAAQQVQSQQGPQAQARKEHLTGMFLSKGCKMSDIRK